MAEYFWNPSLMRHVFAVPEEIVDRHLRLAREDHLKVLLWVSRNGLFDAEACERATGVLASNCVDALQYWVAAGVLSGGEPVAATPTPPKDEIPPAPKPKAAARPKVHKPQLTEVIRRQQQDGEFDGLLAEVSARMGRPLGNGDLETLLYLYESVGLPAAVILMVVGYAAQMGRINMRYIEKVALDWADRGIVTMAAAEEHLCYLERCEQAVLRVQAVCRLEKPLTTATAMRAAEKWICAFGITDEVLAKAYAICLEKTGKFDVKYIDRVLENWHAQGADTTEKVEALTGKKQEKTHSFDHTEYEDMVEHYVPVYKKKKR
ncbi:MAG: DnaD domain protein [Clostridia bacterium]|nr:DnaD domain protein [Clostridia bacterium]